MAPRKAVDAELNRSVILQAARTLFADRGYHSVSMRAVAASLNYTPGSLYYHFKNKAELFSAVIAEDFTSLNGLLDEARLAFPDGGSPLLQSVFLSFIRFGMVNKRSFELMFLIEDPELETYAGSVKMSSYEKFAKVIEQGIQGFPAARQNRIELIWSLFLALHGFVAYYVHTDRTYEDISKLAETHTNLLLNGLT